MAGVKLGPFTGLFPRVPDTDLPSGAATIAENIDFAYGELRSLRGDYKLRDLNVPAQSLFSEDGLRFYAWSEDVDAVISPLQNGPANDRLYYTTATDFRVAPRSGATAGGSTPAVSFRVGVPRPTVAPKITVVHPVAPANEVATVSAEPADTYADRLKSAQATLDAKAQAAVQWDTETRAYAYTFANAYNEEGPPSDPVMVDVKALTINGTTTYSTVTVQVVFDGSGEYVPITEARIYRTAKGGTTADYYYATTASAAKGPVDVRDDIASEALNETLASMDSYPPDLGLHGLISLGNGILAAWQGNVMRFSDAYRPWAWNPTNFVTFDYPVVGAITHGAGALVTTVGSPAIVSGVSPDAMTQIPLAIPQAGVSKWAMLSMGGMAIYACNDGIVAVNGGQPDLTLSEKFFTREVWRKRYAAGLGSMQFSYYDGRVVVFSKAGAFTPFMIDLDEARGSMTELPSLVAKTAIVLTTSDQMYMVNGTALIQFGGGSTLPLHWKSGDIVLTANAALAMAQVECTGDFTIKFYQNGQLGYTKTVSTGSTNFRLPRGAIPGHAGLKPSDRWQFEITGSGTLKWLKAASSGRSMAEV
jgi:hypothetical protein